MKYFKGILFFVLLWSGVAAQSYTYTNSRFKGSYGDGQDRSAHSFVLEKVKGPAVLCEGDTAVFSIGYEGTHVCDFKWRKVGDSRDSWCDSSEMKILGVTTAHRGKYYCCLIDISSGAVHYSDTVELKIKKRPVPLIGSPVVPYMQCFGDSTVLNALASESDKETGDTYSYSWDGPHIESSSNLPQITVKPTETTVYTVTVNNNGCRADTSIEIEVYKPRVDIPGVIYLAQDMPLKIAPAVPSTAVLNWKIGDVSVTDKNPLEFNGITRTTDIHVTMTDRGCVAVDSGVVYFKRGRGYKGGFQDGFDRSDHSVIVGKINYPGAVCEGDLAQFTVDYEGTFVCDYEWHKIGRNEVLADTSVLVLPATGIEARGKYYCKLIDISSGKAFFSDTVELKVRKRPVPVIGSPASPTLICYGDTIMLNASASEAGKEDGDVYSYSWSGDGIVSNSNISLVKVSPKVNTVYTVTVSNGGCSADTTVGIISYRPVVDLPDYVYISEGNTLELTVDVPDVAKLIWSAEGNVFEDINPFVYPDIRQTMEVKVKMLNEGCEASDECKVYVKRGRGYQGGMQDGFDRSCNPPVILEQNRSEASCLATGAELWVKAEGSSLEYIWQKFNDGTKTFEEFVPAAGSSVSGFETGKLVFDNLLMEDNGVYLCRIRNACGSVTTDTFSLSVGGVPVLKSGLNREWDQCVDGHDSTHLNVAALDPQGKEMRYAWYKVDTLRHTYTLLKDTNVYNQPYLKLLLQNKTDEGMYLVNIRNECGDTRDSVFVPVNLPVKIVAGGNMKKDITACVGGQAEFSVQTTGGGKVRYTLMKVNVTNPYPLEFTPEDFFIGGSEITIDNLTQGDEGNYVWVVDNGCGRDTSDIIRLKVETPPVVSGEPDTLVRCEGEPLRLTCTASAQYSELKYEWFKNGVSTGVTGLSYAINRVSAADEGNYMCRVSNSCPVVEGPVKTLTVRERPRILDRPYIKDFYCEGDTLQLKVELGITGADSVRWFHNGNRLYDRPGRIAGSATNRLSIDSIVAADGGSYRIQAYNECGASDFSEAASLTVDLPARFTTDLSGYTDLVLCDGDDQSLTVATSGTAPIRYIWTHNAATVAEGFSHTLQLNNVKADTAGLYCCEIQNRCGGQVACAQIKVSHPDTFRFELNAVSDEVCAGDPDGLTAVLMGSDTNTLYYLYKEPGELVTKIHGRALATPGGFIEFTGLRGGTYYVMGEDTRFTQGCTYRMPGEVVITENPLPLQYDLFIREHLCREQHQATLALAGSERDIEIEYTLYKQNGTEWIPYLNKVRGTGDTIVWQNIPEGNYKVMAENVTTGCRRDMRNLVSVEEHDLPAVYSLEARGDDSVYCANALPDVVLELSGREEDTKYILYRADTVYRVAAYVSSWDRVESGVYRVKAVNKWGCLRKMGQQQVLSQQPPVGTQVVGGMIYCENQTGTARIEIKDTRPAYTYRVYRESPRIDYLDTMGNGGSVFLQVPLEDKSYYVVAEDTTREHCRTALADTAVFRMSRLKVVGNPAEHYIWNGERCTLPVIVTGQEGTLTVHWTPAAKLEPGQDTLLTPATLPVTERQDYVIRVQDYSACAATATVSVIVKSEKLACDIRETDRITSVDTVRACQGADMDLYAWVDGGTGSYDYLWRDAGGEVGREQVLQHYTRQTDGWLILEVKSAEITQKDSVWVELYDNPQEFALLPGGLMCVQKNTTPVLNLSGAQAGIRYILSYSTDLSRFNDIDTTNATGGPVSFPVADGYTREGYYTVRAEYVHSEVTCRLGMQDTVEMRKGAGVYPLSGSREYCEREAERDTLHLAYAETGVNYALYRENPLQLLLSLPGRNAPLDFTGNFGSGRYFVTATNGACVDTMAGRVDLMRHNSPADLGIPERGSYCDGDHPARVSVNGAQEGVEYVLMRRNFGLPDTEIGRQSGPGNLVFAAPAEVGEYYIVAYGANHCERIFHDRIRISGTLSDVNVDGDRKYCDSEAGYGGWLKITNPQDGATYQLLTEAGEVKGTFDSTENTAAYFRGMLPEGTYKIRAIAGRCSLDLVQTVQIRKQTLPGNNALIPPYTLCQGDGLLAMSVVASAGYEYTLYRDSAGVETKLATRPGQAGTVYFDRYDKIGDYRVEVKHTDLGCVWTLSEKYHIDRPLQEFPVSGDTLYCASEEGVVIRMDSTENNIEYVLEKWNPVYAAYQEADRLTGRGMAVAFKGYYPEGNYRVKAVRGCEKLMKNELRVKSKAVPADSTLVVLEGNGCIDSTIVIRLQKSEADVVYTLYHEGNPVGSPLQGQDVHWTIDKARRGTYKITADKDGCLYVFPKKVEIGELPFIRPLAGDSLLCANRYGELYMTDWDREAVYTLYDRDRATIAVGAESSGKLYFSAVPVGTFYAVAARGNCEVRGESYTVDSIPVPVLPESFWTVSECVKRGEGEIVISGMTDTLRYVLTNSGGTDLLDYKGPDTDTAFRHLPFDHYCLYAEDEKSHCRSDELCATINESVTDDSLIGEYAYCAGEAGATLRLSGTQRGMVYQMLTLEGDLIEEITNGSLEFARKYRKGSYIFRKERTGVLGGCWMTDTVEIDSFAYPLTDIQVEITGGGDYLCEKGGYTVKLKNSETGYEYRLIRDPGAVSEVYVDTVAGNGGEVEFSRALTDKGFYKIYAQPAGGVCGLYLDTTFRVYAAPKPVTAQGCSYCVAPAERDSCAISISSLAGGVRYLLTTATGTDTVFGPGRGSFKGCEAGMYAVIGEDLITGCRDTVARVKVNALPKPKVYTVDAVCGESGEICTIDGSEGDSISYYLYRDGIEVAGPVKGNGTKVSFGSYEVPGTYKIKAVSEGGCESWMCDSATLYQALGSCSLTQEGHYCQNGDTGVTIKYTCSSKGWNYFLRKATVWSTDTLKGNGGELSWSAIAGNRILSGGTYDLYAANACETRMLQAVTVEQNPLPEVVRLEGSDAAICSGTGVDVVLSRSQQHVHYQLMYVNSGREVELTREAGSGGALWLGNYSAIGQYIVYAIVDSSGCRAKMDERMFYPGSTPEVKRITGSDICLNGETALEMNLCVTAPLQAGVDYILHLKTEGQETMPDTIIAGASELCFETRRDTGCYYVVARDAATGCEKTMDGQYCAGLPPRAYPLVVPDDTVKLCRGEKYCIQIENSDAGVKYALLRDGVQVGQAVAGEGFALEVGCAEETGVYRVKAYVGNDCWLLMDDSVIVKVNELQGMFLQEKYSYCSLDAGVTIGVKQPTNPLCTYTLTSPEGRLLETRSGDPDNKGFDFSIAGPQQAAGFYKISVTNPAGCERLDSVEVSINPLPEPYRLNSTNGEWLCVNGTVEMYTDTTEAGVEYHLYRKNPGNADQEVGWKYGTGGRLTLATVNVAGEYYVEGVNYSTGCRNGMFNHFVLRQADTVRSYKVEGLVTGYCYTDPAKGSLRLSNSKPGVVYALYRDGAAVTGEEKAGTGSVLVWTGLEGKPCSNKVNVTDAGYQYEVLARDTLTGCIAWMNGKVGIVEESDPALIAWHPNNDLQSCQGKDVKFSLSATGCNLNYVWKHDGAVVKDSTEEFYNIESVEAADFGTYYCEVSNSCGSESTPPVRLKVRDSLFYLKRMEDKAVCGNMGEPVMLTGYIQNGTSYEWCRLDDPTPLSYAEWYKIRSVKPEHAGFYVFKAKNECGSLSDTLELKIAADPAADPVVFRTDTICAGTSYRLTVVSPDTVKWYRDGVFTGVVGNDLMLNAAAPGDEGLYSVRIVNACAPSGKPIPVAQLYVDDTIRVLSLRPSELVCENAVVDLYIRTSPEKRVSYTWETGGVVIARDRNTYRTGPLTSDEPEYTYFVNYRNKCTDATAQIRLSVSNKLEYTDPVEQIITCAGSGQDTAIFVGHPATLIASYQWYWQSFAEGTVPVKLEGEVYDTLYLKTATSAIGYYYCEIGRVCNPVTTQSCWFRVDTVPVLEGNLPAFDTTCQNASYRWEVAAMGGGLTYEWNFRLKDGSTEVHTYENALLHSTGFYEMSRVDAKYDSCRVWCRVFNGCGEVTTDPMLLRVKAEPRLLLTPADTTVCRFADVVIAATLQSGKLPYSYGYSYNNGEIRERSCNTLTDTLPYEGGGSYRIQWVETDGCRVNGEMATATVNELPAVKVKLVRDNPQDTICMSDTLHFRLLIEGGNGPWEIGIRNQDGQEAEELGLTYPFTISSREKHFDIVVYDDLAFYVDSVRDLNAANSCVAVTEDTVKIVADPGELVTLRALPDHHTGICRTISLDSLLTPQPADGQWYVNGEIVDSLWIPAGPTDTVCYVVGNERGCVSYERRIFVVDSLPYGELILPEVACGTTSAQVQLQLYPGAQDYRVDLRQTRYPKGGGTPVVYERQLNVAALSGGKYSENVVWNAVGESADSCILYEITNIQDSHGCRMSRDIPADIRDTLYRSAIVWRQTPGVTIQSRYPSGSLWQNGSQSWTIPEGDSVEVRASLNRGVPEWHLPGAGVGPVSKTDTVFWLRAEGGYSMMAVDSVCGTESAGDSLVIAFMKDSYFCGRLWLEGPYDASNGRMFSALNDSLHLPPVSSLPLLPAGVDLIDRIVLELRAGSQTDSVALLGGDTRIVATDTCYLASNGRLVDRYTGDTLIRVRNAYNPAGNHYYLVAHHRNHLSVMTAVAYDFPAMPALAPRIDFTLASTIYSRDGKLHNHMSLRPGYTEWMLSAGELNDNSFITLFDPNLMTLEDIRLTGSVRYDLLYDLNFDGKVDWPGWNGSSTDTADWNLVKRNRQKFTEIK